MALSGAKPNPDRTQVRRTNKPLPGTEWVEVQDVPFDGPALPESRDVSRISPIDAGLIPTDVWPPATERWWEVVRTMPHAALWKPADWEVAFAAAETHARFTEAWKGCAGGAELRQREKQLGMSADARRDLRIRYVPVKPTTTDTPDNVTQIADFRGL